MLRQVPCLTDGDSFPNMCYSDISVLYYWRGLKDGQIPYLDSDVEYPVLTGAFMELGRRLVMLLGGQSHAGVSDAEASHAAGLFFGVNAVAAVRPVLCADLGAPADAPPLGRADDRGRAGDLDHRTDQLGRTGGRPDLAGPAGMVAQASGVGRSVDRAGDRGEAVSDAAAGATGGALSADQPAQTLLRDRRRRARVLGGGEPAGLPGHAGGLDELLDVQRRPWRRPRLDLVRARPRRCGDRLGVATGWPRSWSRGRWRSAACCCWRRDGPGSRRACS